MLERHFNTPLELRDVGKALRSHANRFDGTPPRHLVAPDVTEGRS